MELHTGLMDIPFDEKRILPVLDSILERSCASSRLCKIDTSIFFENGMFAIGINPQESRDPEQKRRVCNSRIKSFNVKFTGRPTSWLIIPLAPLSFFQRLLYEHTPNSFTGPYFTSVSFVTKFPPNSYEYSIANAVFPTSIEYEKIPISIEEIYLKNIRIRWAMKKLMNAWKRRHFKFMNEEDIATQEVPKNPVVLINWATKTVHKFEAMTILRDCVNRLLNHDELFLIPLDPRNPYTNTPLSYGTLVSIRNQLRRAGINHWLWEAFVSSNFNLLLLEKNYEVPMKLRCLDLLIKNNTHYITIDFVMDFVISEYSHHASTFPPNERTVMGVLITKWDTPKVQEWIKLCVLYWTNEIRGRSEENILIHTKSGILIKSMKSWYAL